MNELALFAGAGGGILGAKLLGWRTLGYVEINEYCQQVIAQRISDGFMDEAPIFGDISLFVSDGYAAAYKGMVDVVSAGFPCQFYSEARQMGKEPEDLWPQTYQVIKLVNPSYVFLENVPGLIYSGYFERVYIELDQAGYSVLPPLKLSAADIGANQKRDRIWIMAYTNDKPSMEADQTPYTSGKRRKRPESCVLHWQKMAEPDWQIPSSWTMRSPDGVAHRVDRIKAIGNGQVPHCMALAWKILGGRVGR